MTRSHPGSPTLRITITGADGFVGRHLARAATAAGHQVIGIGHKPLADPTLDGILDESHVADLREGWPDDALGDVVIHLAGRAAVGPSFDDPQGYICDNSAMVTSLGEAILKRPRDEWPRVVLASTGAVYDAAGEATPRTEQSPIRHASPYVVSKLLVESQLLYYRERGVDAVIVRPFNHIGPGQAGGFLVPDLTAALEALPADEPLLIGDLDTQRDYTDVRDVVAAYLLLAEAPTTSEVIYNVASGRSHPGLELLGYICEALGRPVPQLEIDERRIRATDARVIVGSADRLRGEFGWEPSIPIRRSVEEFVTSRG